MCEADKQFLKRSFHQQLQYSPCKNAASVAPCPPRPRGWCQECRLLTCLSNPVNIAMIRVGDKGGNKKCQRGNKTEDPSPPSRLFNIEQNDEFQMSRYYSAVHGLNPRSIPPPPVNYQYLQYSIPYDIPYSKNTQSLENEIEKLLVEPIDDVPLDLSVKPKVKKESDEWFLDELVFTEFPSQQHGPDPLDLSTSFDGVVVNPWIHSVDGRVLPSPSLEANNSVNKLSVNSTVLGHALAQIQSSISMSSSLANLSSVSDILPDEAETKSV